MTNEFLELKSTEGQSVYVRPEAVGAFEVVPASNRVDGHVKLFVSGFKFTVQISIEDLLQRLSAKEK